MATSKLDRMGPRSTERQTARATTPRQAFYVLMETPCPYLPDRNERKLMTQIGGSQAVATYSALSRAGFRRSHSFAYRPACSKCSACVPVRVRAADFEPSRSLRRVGRMNQDLVAEDRPAQATREQYALFNRYIGSRHGDGEMANMTFAEYRDMVEETRLDSRITEFRDADGGLVAACLTDWLEDGPSAVYSFFEPRLARRSLGSQMVLWLIDAARNADRSHVYLGYWIAESPKMAYKARFRPLEGLGRNGWHVLET